MSKSNEKSWVSASRTRNFMLGDPLLDWLELYGAAHGFVPDNIQAATQGTDFSKFIMKKGRDFERRLMVLLKQKLKITECVFDDSMTVEEKSIETANQMKRWPEAIYQGCVADPLSKTFGYPDLLMRSDVVSRLWPEALVQDAARQYVVVDIKFTTLRLKVDGTLGNDGSAAAYKAQLFIVNQALGAMQGLEPETAFLLGRSWAQGTGAKAERGSSAFEKLGPVPMREVPKKGLSLSEKVEEAVTWCRRVIDDGATWEVLPTPSVAELRPNMGNSQDAPWHRAKKEIAEATGELTLLWQVGLDKRNAALAAGVTTWRDVDSPLQVGIKGEKTAPVLAALLDVHAQANAEVVQPATVRAAVDEWGETPELEFYVDFETVSDLNDDFENLPQRGGQPLIFMIGCGHIERGEWSFREFTVERLDEDAEGDVIDAWLAHMAEVKARLSPCLQLVSGETRSSNVGPKVIHWSHAEVSMLESAYNSAMARHPDRNWPTLNWFDFLKRVMKAEPVVVRGALGFGLKAIAKALHSHGLIATCWEDGPADGLGAMVGAWSAAETAEREGTSLRDVPLMREIAAYNEVDTKVMWEIVSLLRRRAASIPLVVAA